ncbi:unnamed protein product [Ilex paraguariensis]|uniref:Uncharacterized protein n=1 Tax=Ilex paraguariensis TaxID=185542 RepID=A0ABC8TKX1_9AQUA
MSSYQDTVQAKIFKFSSVWIHCQVYLMGWGNIYRRRMRVFTLAIVIYMDYKALQQREKWMSKTKRADLWQKAHERNAKRVLNLMIALEGLWVKLGQYLSTRADVLPEPYICLLKQLQDSLPPRPLEEVIFSAKNFKISLEWDCPSSFFLSYSWRRMQSTRSKISILCFHKNNHLFI